MLTCVKCLFDYNLEYLIFASGSMSWFTVSTFVLFVFITKVTFIPSFLQKQMCSDLEENPRRALMDYGASMILNFPPFVH